MTQINSAFIQQEGITQQATEVLKSSNPYNLINCQTAEEVGKIAQNEIGTMPYRIATAGYSAPPQGYEEATKIF